MNPVSPSFALRADNPAPRLPLSDAGPNPAEQFIEKHRPQSIRDMVGQGWAALQLATFLESPYPCAFLFEGPTGVGKTTAARALAHDLGCCHFGGLFEVKSGAQDAEAVEKVLDDVRFTPMMGSGWKVIIVDEADYASVKARQIWLSALEDLPRKTIVVFTTNHADKFEDRFLDRCERIRFSSDAATLLQDAQTLINRVWHQETGRYDAPTVAMIPGLVSKDGSISFRRAVAAVAPMVRAFRSELARAKAEQVTPVVEAAPAPAPVAEVPVEAEAPKGWTEIEADDLPPLSGGSDDATATVEAPAARPALMGPRAMRALPAPAKPKRVRKPRAKKSAPAPVQEVPAVDLGTAAVDCSPPVACATVTTVDVQLALEAGNDRLVIVTLGPPSHAPEPRPDPTARFVAARARVEARRAVAHSQSAGPVASQWISARAVDLLARLRRAAGRLGADRRVIMSTSGAVATTTPPSPPRGRFEPESPASDARTDAGLAGEMVTIEGRQYRMTSYGETAGRRGYCLEYGTTAHDVEERADGRVACTCPSFIHRCAILPGAVCKHGEYLIARGLLAQRTPTPEPDPDPTPGRPVEADTPVTYAPAVADFALPAICGGSDEADEADDEECVCVDCGLPVDPEIMCCEPCCMADMADDEPTPVADIPAAPPSVVSGPADEPDPDDEATPVAGESDALEQAEDYVLRLEMELAAARREVERLRALLV